MVFTPGTPRVLAAHANVLRWLALPEGAEPETTQSAALHKGRRTASSCGHGGAWPEVGLAPTTCVLSNAGDSGP